MMKKQRDSVIYSRAGDAIEVRHICSGQVVDVQFFRCNHEVDNQKLFDYVCCKLGFTYCGQKAKPQKEDKWEWS